ncbi:MAG: regulatory protein RecX [Microscillaceae bacterium]
MPKKVYNPSEAYAKAARYCAYQERSQQEVRARLQEYGWQGQEAEALIARLIEDNFINEERFARTYAGGKFRLKQWGRRKIEQGLRSKGLSEYCVQAGLSEIAREEYQEALKSLLEKKNTQLAEEPPLLRKQKLLRYALAKGYEQDLIWQILSGL